MQEHHTEEILGRIGWQNILDWGKVAYPSLAYQMYASFSRFKATETECCFYVMLEDGEVEITPERIGSILNIPYEPHSIQFVSDTISEADKPMITQSICAFVAEWDQAKNFLRSKYLIHELRLIHNLFTHNVYPRAGNRTELTAYMVNILFNIVNGNRMCLPSLICRHIIRNATPRSKAGSLIFGCLMSALALSIGVNAPDENPIQIEPFSHQNLSSMNLVPHEYELAGVVPPEPQGFPADPGHDDIQLPPHPAPRSLEERFTAMEHEIASIKKKQSVWMKKIFQYMSRISKSCRRDDVQAPPSPSPPPDSADEA